MIEYKRSRRSSRTVIHAVENGQSLCGANIVLWGEDTYPGLNCGLCISKLAIRKKAERLKPKAVSEPTT